MANTSKVDAVTALHATYKLVRILLEHQLETGSLTPRRLRELASAIEDGAMDSRDPHDHRTAGVLRDVVEATVASMAARKRLPAGRG